jgi:DNA-binding NtrC family response regulator
MKPHEILIIEDEHALGKAISLVAQRAGYAPQLTASGAAALAILRSHCPTAVVLDIGLPDMSGLDVLREIRKLRPALPVLIITAHGSLENAIQSQKLGATQYLVKPLDLVQFETALSELVTAEDPPVAQRSAPQPGGPLIGGSASMQDVYLAVARACTCNVPVLISGPDGAGKSLVARIIHDRSAEGRVFREFNPSEIPAAGNFMELLTNAPANAHQTIVLDDITALPSAQQKELLEWLSGNGPQTTRLLVICRGDPREAVAGGSLRSDLYYALCPQEVRLPALKNRATDIPALAAFFVGLKSGESSAPRLGKGTLLALQGYDWPGNVRELRHVLEYAVTVARGAAILPSHLPNHVIGMATTNAPSIPSDVSLSLVRWLDAELESPLPPSYDALMDRMETIALRHLLAKHDGKPTRLAAALNLNRATLRQKLRRLGLEID